MLDIQMLKLEMLVEQEIVVAWIEAGKHSPSIVGYIEIADIIFCCGTEISLTKPLEMPIVALAIWECFVKLL